MLLLTYSSIGLTSLQLMRICTWAERYSSSFSQYSLHDPLGRPHLLRTDNYVWYMQYIVYTHIFIYAWFWFLLSMNILCVWWLLSRKCRIIASLFLFNWWFNNLYNCIMKIKLSYFQVAYPEDPSRFTQIPFNHMYSASILQ